MQRMANGCQETVRLVNTLEEAYNLYFVMELCCGPVYDSTAATSLPVDEKTAFRIVRCVASAEKHLHDHGAYRSSHSCKSFMVS